MPDFSNLMEFSAQELTALALRVGTAILWLEERLHLRLDETFAYGDGENPLNAGVIDVDPSAPPGTRFIYLPVAAR